MKGFLSLLFSFCIMGMFVGCGQEQGRMTALRGNIQSSEDVSPARQGTMRIPPSVKTTTVQGKVDTTKSQSTEAAANRILIAYFSWSGNTKQVANEIQSKTGGDIFEISPLESYPANFDETADRWHKERDTDARPKIIGAVDNMQAYEYVFLGYPVWSSDLPAVNRTFLEQYDFSGKTIIPFCTHGGSSFGNSINRIKRLAPGATIRNGYEIRGSNAGRCADEVAEWIEKLKIKQ